MPLSCQKSNSGSRVIRSYRFYHMAAALLLACAPTARAARVLSASERAVINFGFATQLGSGIYSLSGRTLQVYRLPFEYVLPNDERGRIAARITLPVTLGFAGFEGRDVVDEGLPEQVDSLSFVPGLAVAYRVRDDWTLEPFAEAGLARDSSSELDQRVYAFGLRSEYEIPSDGTDWRLHNELVHAVVREPDVDRTDDFTRFRIGTTARRPFVAEGTGRRPDWLGYGLVEIYTDVPGGPFPGEDRNGHEVQYEAGVTLGATETLRIGRIPLPRIGLGYRFGDDLSVYRIVFGAPW